jgi:hypothetical protein
LDQFGPGQTLLKLSFCSIILYHQEQPLAILHCCSCFDDKYSFLTYQPVNLSSNLGFGPRFVVVFFSIIKFNDQSSLDHEQECCKSILFSVEER